MISNNSLYYNTAIGILVILFFVSPKIEAKDFPFKKGTDTSAINTLIRIASNNQNPDSSVQLLNEAAKRSLDGDYYIGALKAYSEEGTRYLHSGNFKKADTLFNLALSFAEKVEDKNRVAVCYNLLGTLYSQQGNYVGGVEEVFKALDLLKQVDTSGHTIIQSYIILSQIYRLMLQPDKEIYYLDKAESKLRAGNQDDNISKIQLQGILLNKGNYFSAKGQPDLALKYYTEVIDSIGKADIKALDNKSLFNLVSAQICMGSIYSQTGDFQKSADYCRKAMEISKNKYGNLFVGASNILGNSLIYMKKYKEAESALLSGLTMKNEAERNQVAVGYYYLIDLYKKTKQYQKALIYSDFLKETTDSLVTVEKAQAVNQVEAKYNSAEKDRQIIKNELLIVQQKNKIIQKNIWIGSISIIVLIIGIFSFGLFRINRRKQEEEIKYLKQQSTISILKGVVQGEENERIRLARDLHDGIGGMLSAIKMRFMALRHDHDDLVNSPKYLEAMGLLDIMGDEIRKTSHNLMPEVLLRQSLDEALQTFCNNFKAGLDLKIDFQSFGEFKDLPNGLKLNIYRIIQELLKNTVQHAGAKNVVVQVMRLEAYLTITVEDDGSGFNPGETKDGIGLQNLKTRVLSLEGHYTVKSDAGKGTTVFIELPLNSKVS